MRQIALSIILLLSCTSLSGQLVSAFELASLAMLSDTGSYRPKVDTASLSNLLNPTAMDSSNMNQLLNGNLTLNTTNTAIYYAHLKRQLDGGYYRARSGMLYFMFEQEYGGPDHLSYEIFNASRQLLSFGTGLQHTGDNRYDLDLTSVNLSQDSLYLFEVQDRKGATYSLKFKYSSTY